MYILAKASYDLLLIWATLGELGVSGRDLFEMLLKVQLQVIKIAELIKLQTVFYRCRELIRCTELIWSPNFGFVISIS